MAWLHALGDEIASVSVVGEGTTTYIPITLGLAARWHDANTNRPWWRWRRRRRKLILNSWMWARRWRRIWRLGPFLWCWWRRHTRMVHDDVIIIIMYIAGITPKVLEGHIKLGNQH